MKRDIALLLLFGAFQLCAAPGNVFLEGEEVVISLPAGASDVSIIDADGTACFTGVKPDGVRLELGKVPVGYYRVEYRTGDGKRAVDEAAVLLPPVKTLNPDSPVGIDAALFYPFYMQKVGSLHLGYTPDDVIGLLRKANLGYARERLMWLAFDYPAPGKADPLIDELMATYQKYGIRVVQSLYGTPPAYRWPKELSIQGEKKPPFDLRKLHGYTETLARRFRNTMPALETWNEPEGIGGELLPFEIAAVQKAAALGAVRGNPGIITYIANAGVPFPAAFAANQLNAYQNVFCVHSHGSLETNLPVIAREMKAAGTLPVWLAEVSTGSFRVDPQSGEFSAETARKQALDVPKLYAEFLAEGADKIIYFFLFRHTEVSGWSFGLLRWSDLSPRPGFVTLATLANYFQNFDRIERLKNLPSGATGYEVSTRIGGVPHRIRLLWNDSAADVSIRVKPEETVRDAFGRPAKVQQGMIKLTDMPVYLLAPCPDAKFESAIAEPKPLLPPSPVVFYLELPDSIKNVTAGFFTLPIGEEHTYPLAVYNFSDAPVSGKIKVDFPNGEAAPCELPLPELPAGARTAVPLKLKLEQPPKTDAPSQVVIRGIFPNIGETVLAADFSPVRTRVMPGDLETPVPGWQNPGKWREYIISGASMKISSDEGKIVFGYQFGDAENRVIDHVWASPTLPLDVRDFPKRVPDAFAFELKLLSGEGLQTLGLNLVEEDYATYFATLPFSLEKLRRGQTFIVPLKSMINPHFRKKDGNGKLDLEKLIHFELPLWAAPHSAIKIAVSNPRWVNYSENKANNPLMSTLIAASHAAEVPGRALGVANAGFSQAKADGAPAAWGVSSFQDPNFSAKIDHGTLKLVAGSKTTWYSVYLSPAGAQALPVPKKGELCRIEFSYRQKNEGIEGHAFGTVELRTADHQRLAHCDGSDIGPKTDWENRNVILDLAEIPKDARYILLSFFLGEATGTVRFDDVKLTVKTIPASR